MQKKRVLYFDVLNILACIAVISLHHNGVVHTYSNSWTWKTALIVETGAYWAVPVFLMLSGATLMNYRENYDTVTFFKKRFSRAVIPFFCWSGIVLIWKLMTDQFSFDSISIKAVINTMLNYKMFTGISHCCSLFICLCRLFPGWRIGDTETHFGMLWGLCLSVNLRLCR